MSAPVSIALLQAQVAEVLRKVREAKPRPGRRPRAIGFHLGAPWSGPSTLRVEGEDLPLFYCPSPLAFRVRLVETEALPVPAVLLTDRSRQELGLDVLARLEGGKLRNLDEWRALTDRFGVLKVDPRLRGLRWLPEVLLALGDDELSRPATQTLDADEVWQLLLSRLGLADARPDLRALLEWTAKAEGPAAFLRLPENARGDYVRRLVGSAGEAAAAILHLVSSRRGEESIAAGLICDLLFSTALAADPETARTAGRFEASLLGGVALTARGGRTWAEAAASLVQRRLAAGGEEAVNPWLSQAERLLDELKARPLGERSAWLPSAFGARVARAAEMLGSWLDRPGVTGLRELAEAVDKIRGHGLAQARGVEIEAVEDLLRLSRYLATRGGRKSAGSFAEAAQDYAREGSFVDRAGTDLADASPLSALLRPVADRILRAVSDRRQADNRRFAELLAKWSEHPTPGGPLVPVESILDRVVAPLAAANPVLLLVLDGLSFAIFRELATDLSRQGWEELQPAEGSGPFHGVGLLPTVTEVCRTSLFCGDRRTGDAAEERRGFAAHPALRQQSSLSLPPVLFHKASLDDGGTGLAEKVTAEVERASRRVVGVVLNAVDDQLSKGRQLVTRWGVSAFRHLDDLLQAARVAGRTVILTADHGHLVERGTELHRHEGGGARYRPMAAAAEGEVAVRGPRVLLGEGKGLVLAWSERLRYSALQSGYHGGASPQEVTVPLSVWVPAGVEIPAWRLAGPELPDWWEGGEMALPVPLAEISPATRTARATTPAGQGLLFAEPAQPAVAAAAAPVPRPAWLADLLTSPIYREQLGRAGRQGLSDDRVEEVLKALDARGGHLLLNALAHQLGISPPRAQGLVAALQRVLNVEGFSVLSLDPESETISLDRGLLARQFPRTEEIA